MLLFTLGIALLAQEPRFVMQPSAGDSVRAEVHFDLSGDSEEQARELLGEGPVETGVLQVGDVGLAYAAPQAQPGPRPLVLFDRSAAPGRACVLRPTGETAVDNTPRALSWCRTFLDQPLAVEVERPAAP